MRAPLTREAIIAATRDLIRAEGLEAVTLRRVGTALGVTAPALYAHVADKRDLLRAVAEGEFAALIERFEDVTEDEPVARMRALARAYIDHARTNPELFRVMFLFPPELPAGPATGQELPIATKAFTMSAAASDAAVADGRFPGADPLMVALTTWSCVHGVATVLQLGFAFDEATEDRLVTSVVDTLLRGLQAG